MRTALASRIREIEAKIAALSEDSKEARAVLFFSGKPVAGSIGIDVNFTGKVLDPFQDMVMADHAGLWHGTVGTRGRRSGEPGSRLLLTAMPRGSVGFALERAETDELFDEGQLAETLAHVAGLIEAAASSDEEFEKKVNETTPRVIVSLRRFLEAIATAKAGLRYESGDSSCTLTPSQARDAFERVNGTSTNTVEERATGIHRGVLMDSWKFDFQTSDGHTLTGKIHDDLPPEVVSQWEQDFFDKRCIAVFDVTTVIYRNGRSRTTRVLKGLEPPLP